MVSHFVFQVSAYEEQTRYEARLLLLESLSLIWMFSNSRVGACASAPSALRLGGFDEMLMDLAVRR